MSKDQAEQLQSFLLSFKKGKSKDELANMKPKDIHQLLKDNNLMPSDNIEEQKTLIKQAHKTLTTIEDDPLSIQGNTLPEPEPNVVNEATEATEVGQVGTSELEAMEVEVDTVTPKQPNTTDTTSSTDVLSLMASEDTQVEPQLQPQPQPQQVQPQVQPLSKPSELQKVDQAIHEALYDDEPSDNELQKMHTKQALKYIKRLRHQPNRNPFEQMVTVDQADNVTDLLQHDTIEIASTQAVTPELPPQQFTLDSSTVTDNASVLAFLANLLLFPRTIIEDPLFNNITKIYSIDPTFIKFFRGLTPAQKLHFLVFANIKDKFKEATKNYKRGSCEPVHTDLDVNHLMQDFERHKATLINDKPEVLLADYISNNEFFSDPEETPGKVLTFIQTHYDLDFTSSTSLFDNMVSDANKINQELYEGCNQENETKLSFDINKLINDKFENVLVHHIIYQDKKRGKNDPLILDDDMVIEAMLHIQKAAPVDTAVLKDVQNNNVYIQSGKTFNDIASIVCPQGNQDLQVLKTLYTDDLLATKVQEFKGAVAKKTPDQIIKMLLDRKDPLVETMNETHRMFLLKFLKHYKSLDALPLPFISPTFTRLTKLQDFPQFFQHSIKEFIDQENNWIANQAASIKQSIDKSNGDPAIELLNVYVKSVSDTSVTARDKKQMLDQLETIIASFPTLERGTNKYKASQEVATEVDRLMEALHNNNFRPVYRAFHVYEKVQYKRMVDPFIPTFSIERRLKRRAAAEHPINMISSVYNDTDLNKCMTYLRTKPWLNYGKDFQWYIRLPTGKVMVPQKS